ncbi:MAG: tRNA methyltransferase ppm2 [Candelina submexicana]|nr:MAG: tRNA methyltransferase ppm2 [Candelina submexicana]
MDSSARAISKTMKKERMDESIMLTNNSSIVSKRSVERLYYPNEPQFFRHFVKKPQRRSPLINRGYWLRMKAIDHVVHDFLDDSAGIKKVVINLGCGYDPLPFQCLSKYAQACHNVVFIDVDYGKLMAKKCEVILRTPELHELLSNISRAADQGVLLRSDHYLAVGCDLRHLRMLDDILAQELDMASSMILCTAEVSITYMDVGAADAVIGWASQFPDVRFCLLEQFLPAGSSHPFAKTMIRHFEKLQTPLRSIHNYRSLADQQDRFLTRGWPVPVVQSLWELWSSPSFLGPGERSALDNIEPFDEWEEFALFASHYVLLLATKSRGAVGDNQEVIHRDVEQLHHDPWAPEGSPSTAQKSNTSVDSRFHRHLSSQDCRVRTSDQGAKRIPQPESYLHYHENLNRQGCRRFGAELPIGMRAVGHHGGLGLQARLNTTDIYSSHDTGMDILNLPPNTVRPRMCHTITRLNGSDCLLVGGRTSPESPLADCWLREGHDWQRIEDIPVPRYRHCAFQLRTMDGDSAVLVFGGKGPAGKVLDDWLLWEKQKGWKQLPISGEQPGSSFGASMIGIRDVEGLLLGGMTQDGIVRSGCWYWTIKGPDLDTVSCQRLASNFDGRTCSDRKLGRFGASLVSTSKGMSMIGGIGGEGALTQDQEILSINLKCPEIRFSKINLNLVGPRPLSIGCTVLNHCGNAYILGGGAVCFSFGAHHNEGIWVLEDSGTIMESPLRLVVKNITSTTSMQANSTQSTAGGGIRPQYGPAVSAVPKFHLESADHFHKILSAGRPVILKGLEIGPCTQTWTSEYLKEQVGVDRQVVVHSAITQFMNFQAKNFTYDKMGFGEFVDMAAKGKQLYLRSLALDQPSERPATLAQDFPAIAEDFGLPSTLAFVAENAHSSPLRISGPVSIWLHYDVMANVLCQIRGAKRLLLYPPTDITHLQIPPGASSSPINVFEAKDSTDSWLSNVHPHEALLEPGDVLFIPSLWPHAVSPVSGLSVAVNVFFRHLRSGYAPGKDIYGNRDLQAYERGRRDIDKIVRAFNELPCEAARFYLKRLAEELSEKAMSIG